uniref:Zgc:92287 n=1 Tax=Neogobius melanostomus TaxID=47308 RepID=A0A8C6UY16_9GOBI
MPVFVDDPNQLSKARLKSDLIAHNVALPPAKSKKQVYVELHTRHVDQKYGADFSSDEEPDQGTDVKEPKDAEALDPSHLTDDGLKAALLQHGVKAGPIVASTRAIYERKLTNLLLSNGHGKSNCEQNGADEAVLYSDSENEEDSDEEQPVINIFYVFLFSATRRRPIKGAAGRPIQYRQEVERRLVPLKIQILVFLIVAIILYVVYVCVEDYSFNPLLALMDVPNERLDTDETGTQEDILELELVM